MQCLVAKIIINTSRSADQSVIAIVSYDIHIVFVK